LRYKSLGQFAHIPLLSPFAITSRARRHHGGHFGQAAAAILLMAAIRSAGYKTHGIFRRLR